MNMEFCQRWLESVNMGALWGFSFLLKKCFQEFSTVILRCPGKRTTRLVPFTLSLGYNSKVKNVFFIFFCAMIIVSPARADIPIDYEPPIKYKNWDDFKESVEKNIAVQKINGKSEVWTGGLALAAGLIGDSLAKDPLEKGVFALFQSIGIASIGLGLYDQAIGENNRNFYYLLKGNSIGLTEDQKNSMVKNYYRINKFYEDKENKNVYLCHYGNHAIL